MASPFDLTTLASAKAWLNISNTNSDAILGPLITAASRWIMAELARPALLPQLFTERYDGRGNTRLYLANWPVLAVETLVVDKRAIDQGFELQLADATPPGRPQAIDLHHQIFPRGRQNIAVTYQAGYAVPNEVAIIPSSAPYQYAALAPYGAWASDLGVIDATTGMAYTLASGAPAAGQYNVAAGLYTFAAVDAGSAIALSYGFVPQDIAQVCTELVAERYLYRLRIGEVSKSIGGQETVSFSQKDMPDALAAMLAPYRTVMTP